MEAVDDRQLVVTSDSTQWTVSVVAVVVFDVSVVQIRRSKQQFQRFDALIHKCLVERHFSRLPPPETPALYLKRLNSILNEEGALSALKCVLILNWLEVAHNGAHLIGPQVCDVTVVGFR